MNFIPYFDKHKERLFYIYDSRADDYIMNMLRHYPVADDVGSLISVGRFNNTPYLTKRHAFLFYVLHKLNVRPRP